MALPDQQRLQAFDDVAEDLSGGELRRLLYVCGIRDTDTSAVRAKETLKCVVMRHDAGHLLLRELMLHLRRFDILRKFCDTTGREEVERTCRQFLPRFRVLMDNISEEFTKEDLNSVKFLLSNTLSREKLGKIESFLDVIIELEKLDLVSPERVNLVEECLMKIGRVDLGKIVSRYKMSAETSEHHTSLQVEDRTPRSLPLPNSPLQETRQGQVLHCENIPLSTNREGNSQSDLDFYKFNANPRGVCVIVDCVGNDGDMLEQTFKALHFNVILYKWLSVADTLSALTGIVRQRETIEGDGVVCCVISRGTANHLLGTDSYGVGLSLDKIRCLFTANECPMLAGKPKLFFIQRYSISGSQPHARMDHRDENMETDGCHGLQRCDLIPTDADVFWSHCWTDEHELEQGHHSVYLKALTDALLKGQMRKTRLVDVHTKVNGAIFEHNEKNPGGEYYINVKHTLRNYLYLQ